MFASIVSPERCELFCVMRTDMRTGERKVLTYPPADYRTCVYRAHEYQRTFDPMRSRFDWRVAHCD